VVFGADTAALTGKEVKAFGGTNALVFYGTGSAVKSGLLDTVTKSLESEGIKYACIGGVQINPHIEFAQKAVDEYRDKNIDFVLGVGGGSVIDTAKAVAHGLASPDIPVWDFFSLKTELKTSLPVGAVVTIAAAGSETSMSAVLTNKTLGMKRGLGTQFNRPRFAIMDPVLTYTLPPRHTACGVADILMHTLERYFAPDADNAVTDELAEALMRVIIKYGKVVMEKPHDYKARAELMWAGSLSHNGLTGLGQSMDFSGHQLGHALSGKYDIPHGESLTIAWPAWAKYCMKNRSGASDETSGGSEEQANGSGSEEQTNGSAAGQTSAAGQASGGPAVQTSGASAESFIAERFAKYARTVWNINTADDEAAALEGITATEDYFRFLGLPVTLTEAVGENCKDDIDTLADFCTYHRTRTIGSFKVLDFDAIREIYHSMV